MNEAERQSVGQDIAQYRRAIWRDMVEGTFKARSAFEISSLQLMTLNLLDGGVVLSIKQLAERLGRSVSAVSRMIDDMVLRGWVDRREDENDRRSKCLALAVAGKSFLDELEGRRIAAQLDLMETLELEEQRIVAAAMRLLAEAVRRRDHV